MGKINETLRRYRERAGLSQSEVAKALDISRQAYSRYENSDIVPAVQRLDDLAKLFHVPVQALYGGWDLGTLYERENDEIVGGRGTEENEIFNALAAYLRHHGYFVKAEDDYVGVSIYNGGYISIISPDDKTTFFDKMERFRPGYDDFLSLDDMLGRAAYELIQKYKQKPMRPGHQDERPDGE